MCSKSHKSRAFTFSLNFEPITTPYYRDYTLEHWKAFSHSKPQKKNSNSNTQNIVKITNPYNIIFDMFIQATLYGCHICISECLKWIHIEWHMITIFSTLEHIGRHVNVKTNATLCAHHKYTHWWCECARHSRWMCASGSVLFWTHLRVIPLYFIVIFCWNGTVWQQMVKQKNGMCTL